MGKSRKVKAEHCVQAKEDKHERTLKRKVLQKEELGRVPLGQLELERASGEAHMQELSDHCPCCPF